MRSAEYKIAVIKRMPGIPQIKQDYLDARMRAFESDSRTNLQYSIGFSQLFPRLLQLAPYNSAVTP